MSAKLKLIWKVDEKPTGMYSSFERRGWPSAEYKNGNFAVDIRCEDEYIPCNVRDGKHGPLTLRIADYSRPSNVESGCGWTQVRSTKQFATLKEAKDAAVEILLACPHLMGKNQV